MANMTAGDVGLRGRRPAALHRLLERARSGRSRPQRGRRDASCGSRTSGRCRRSAACSSARPRSTTRSSCAADEVYARGLKGNLGMGLTLGGLLLSSLLGRLRTARSAPTRSRSRSMTAGGPSPAPAGPRDHAGPADPRLAAVLEPGRRARSASPASRIRRASLVRSAPKVLYGWRRATLPADSYVSCGAERIALSLDGAVHAGWRALRAVAGSAGRC